MYNISPSKRVSVRKGKANMKDGAFLEYFFSSLGELGDPNTQGEYTVRCPFEHEEASSRTAHVNLDKAVFHCKVCRAEGKFEGGGLSEIGFISAYYKISYPEALIMKETLVGDDSISLWDGFEENLWKSEMNLDILRTRRGITDSTTKTYKLGYRGDGIMYPVFIFGELCDVRTYDPDGKPKMKSQKGATTLLFPFDHWYTDERPTLLVGGENDCLLARQLGFNALTFTGGEGSVPSKMFLRMFNGKTVYICYDGDLAGQKGAQRVAFLLKEAGANVLVMDITSSGLVVHDDKANKDLSDLVLQHNQGYDDILHMMEEAPVFSEMSYQEEKNKFYPLVDLWDASEGRNNGRRLSSRVTMIGKYDMDMQVPSAVKMTCKHADDPDHDIEKCPLHKKERLWTLNENNLKDLMYLIEVKEMEQLKALYSLNYMVMKDSCVTMKILSHELVQKAIFVPDVETEYEADNFRSVEQYAYIIGDRLRDGNRYRVFFKAYAHPVDKQRIYLIVDRTEESDNAVNTFKVTEAIKDKLSVFKGPPKQMMKARYDMARGIVKGFTTEMLVWAVDMVYHGVMNFTLMGEPIKGYPEVAVVGETRTGKSSTSKALQKYYRLGNRIALKGASVAGILGGMDRIPNGGYKVRWGTVPMNNKGMLIMDEMSGAGVDVLSALTDMRDSGEASLNKIGGSMKSPARTRLLWVGNPRVIDKRTKLLRSYPSGVEAVLDLVGASEDIARFDAIVLIEDKGGYVRPDSFSKDSFPHDKDVYSDLIRWVWSRKPEQVKFDPIVETYLWGRSQILNEAYNADVKLLGSEAHKKLARFAVSCAACCFSTDETGETLIVQKEHVDWAEAFINECYDNDIFRLKEYVAERRMYNTINPEIENVVHQLLNVTTSDVMIRELVRSTDYIPKGNLQSLSSLSPDSFGKLINYMTRHHLIYNHARGIQATQRLILAARTHKRVEMIPLTERM